MPIPVECLECSKRLNVKDDAAGKRIKCPGCGSPITVPGRSGSGDAPRRRKVARRKATQRAEEPSDSGELNFAQLNALANRSESLGAGEVRECPECGEPVGKFSNECPHCEAVLVDTRKSRKKKGSSGSNESDGNGVGNMIFGALWVIGGLAVTIGSYYYANENDKFVLAWGAVLGGAIQFFKGVGQAMSK